VRNCEDSLCDRNGASRRHLRTMRRYEDCEDFAVIGTSLMHAWIEVW
jgi:hypothetical protein